LFDILCTGRIDAGPATSNWEFLSDDQADILLGRVISVCGLNHLTLANTCFVGVPSNTK